MMNLVVLSILFTILNSVLGASIPDPFSDYINEHLKQEECHFPSRAVLDVDKFEAHDGFQYQACRDEMINNTSIGKACNGIIELTEMVCNKVDDKFRSKFTSIDFMYLQDTIGKEYSQVQDLSQKVDTMCKQPYAFGQHGIFDSSQTCIDSCKKKEYFYICSLYFEMEKVERTKFKDIKDFIDLDSYISTSKGRHTFPPVGSIVEPVLPLYNCTKQTPVTSPVCVAILNVSGLISDMALPEISFLAFYNTIKSGTGCGNFSGLPTLEKVNVQPCITSCTEEIEQICRSLVYGIQYLKKSESNKEVLVNPPADKEQIKEGTESLAIGALKLGDKCDESASHKCPENAECKEQICNCILGFSNNNGTCDKIVPINDTPAAVALKLGDKCDVTASPKCPENAECMNETCNCSKGYLNNNIGTCDKIVTGLSATLAPAVVALKLGDKCDVTASSKCPENAECQNETCSCSQGYLNKKNETCDKIVPTIDTPAVVALKLGDKCDVTASPKCPDNAECQNETCSCSQGYLNNNNGACDKIVTGLPTTLAPALVALKLGEKCDVTASPKCPENAECKNETCSCSQGYLNNNNGACDKIVTGLPTTLAPAVDATGTTTDYDYYDKYDDDDDDEEEEEGLENEGDGLLDEKTEDNKDRPIPKKPSQTVNNQVSYMPSNDEEAKGGIGFMSYLLVFTVLVVAGYLLFHNKKKIIAMVVEGKHGGNGSRRPNTSQYRKLKTDEVMPNLEKSAPNTNYVY